MLDQDKVYLENKTHSIPPTINEMTYLEMGHSEPYFNRNYFMTQDKMQAFAHEHNYRGIYRSAFRYNTTNVEDIKNAGYLFADLFFDFDSDTIYNAQQDILQVIYNMHVPDIYRLPKEAFHIFFSGKKGFHLIIPHEYLGIRPHPHLDKLFKWIATGFQQESIFDTIDTVIYERRRLWRMENTIHPSTGLYKIPITYPELQTLSIEEIQALATQPRYLNYPEPYLVEKARKRYLKEAKDMQDFNETQKKRFENYVPKPIFSKEEIPDYVQKLIDEGPIEGYRNETIAALSSLYFQLGYSFEEAYDSLLDWSQGSLPEHEVKATVKSIFDSELIYGKRRFKALAEKDMTLLARDKKTKASFWKDGVLNYE